jgi:hypothetical protein
MTPQEHPNPAAPAYLPLPVLLNPPVTPIKADLHGEQPVYDPVTQTGTNFPMIAGTAHATCYYAGGVDWHYNDTWETPY